MEFKLRAFTDIWTGGVEGKSDKLHITGIKGSLRWWYEALVRGLGYYACDPSNENLKCAVELKGIVSDSSFENQVKKQICAACYLFGCTGWSGKFILRVEECNSKGEKTRKVKKSAIRRGDIFVLKLVERKEFEDAEKKLLRMTFKLIVDYGSIGGKTTFKPSESREKNTRFHHLDFGIVGRAGDSGIPTGKINGKDVEKYLKGFKRGKNLADWPNLKRFWFADGFIDQQRHNALVARNSQGRYDNPSELQVFLGGYIKREVKGLSNELKDQLRSRGLGSDSESKKIFSFHGEQSGIARCWGYVRNDKEDFNRLKGELEKLKKEGVLEKIKWGGEVLNEL